MDDENTKAQPSLNLQNLKLVQANQRPDVDQLHQEADNALSVQFSKLAWKLRKPLWPIISLAMLVLAGFTGWKVYQWRQQASSIGTTEIPNFRACLPVRVTRAQQGLIQAWGFDESIPIWKLCERFLVRRSRHFKKFLAQCIGVMTWVTYEKL